MNRVVITGAGIVSPNGLGIDEFSRSLKTGNSGLAEIDIFDARGLSCRVAGQVADSAIEESARQSGLFTKFPELAAQGDRKLVFGAIAFLEAITDLDEDLLRECAICLGTSLESFQIARLFEFSPGRFDVDTYAKGLSQDRGSSYLQAPLDFLGGAIARRYGVRGPNLLNCSACTASTQAIGHSFQMIRSGRCRRVIAGGMDSMLNPLGLGGFSVLGALSTENEVPSRAIRPFDLWREGTVLGEGSAMLILEERETAIARGAHIFAEILGYGSTFDAYKLSEPDPSGRGIAMAMQRALASGGVAPEEVDYICAHGTGTPLNDKMETSAIKEVFGPRAHAIPVSSVKSMIGHLIGASGAVELAAILCMMRDGFIAPTINLEHHDRECDLDYVPNAMRPAELKVCLKNSMGFGGQNAALVLGRHGQETQSL